MSSSFTTQCHDEAIATREVTEDVFAGGLSRQARWAF